MADQDALLSLLSANGLEKYHAVFLENDIDTIELALSLTSEELKEQASPSATGSVFKTCPAHQSRMGISRSRSWRHTPMSSPILSGACWMRRMGATG
jgi:hypothetical protein